MTSSLLVSVMEKKQETCQKVNNNDDNDDDDDDNDKKHSYPFSNKTFKDFERTFKDTFPIFQTLHSVEKRALSLCLC